jgi:hypothetical protein
MTDLSKAFDVLESDQIYRDQLQSMEKLKFMTTSFKDLQDAKSEYNYHGIDIKGKLFVPSEDIQDETSLKYGMEGNSNTNYRVKTQLGQLPLPTMPSRYNKADGDTGVENQLMRDTVTPRDLKSAIPYECGLYNRTFNIFSNDMPSVSPVNGVEKYEQFGPRGGYPTRLDNSS